VALLLLALLLAACSLNGEAGVQPGSTPGANVAANAQDLIASPVATATVPPVTPTATASRIRATGIQPTAKGVPAAPSVVGRVILVSLSRQRLYAYDNGALAFSIQVVTGRPELPTPTGLYHVFLKACSDLRWTSNVAPTATHNANCTQHVGDGFQEVFNSPWPKGSPYWYAPTHINYALQFLGGGYYLHDAWWHVKFGPGANLPHQLSNGTWESGSHGCVGMPTSAAEMLYAWTPLGTPVYIRADV
jgi:lipoprotein-anchoring transpeptidase ErfK/SrfK